MASVVDIVGYIVDQYPRKNDLSKMRLTMLVYLADWRCVLQTGRPISDIEWQVYRLGPYSDDVMLAVESRPDLFVVRPRLTSAGNPKDVVELVTPFVPNLTAEEKQAIDHVIRVTKDLDNDAFLRLVRSTYPALTQPLYVPLDLPALARQYRAEFPPLDEAGEEVGPGPVRGVIDAVQRWRHRLLGRAC